MSPPWWVQNQVALACSAAAGLRSRAVQWPQQQADPRPEQGGRGSVCRRGSLTGWECRDTTGRTPHARHKLQNNLFPVTHSWGPASTPQPQP